jgi:hypothetical protein
MAEMLASNLIRLLVTVAILAAVYLFAIKPILDTTNEAFESVTAPFGDIQSEIQNSFDDAGIDGFDVDDVKLGGKKDKDKAQRLLDCVQRAQPDTKKMRACVKKFQG